MKLRYVLALLSLALVSSTVLASDIFDVTDYGSGYQIWLKSSSFDLKDDNYTDDADAALVPSRFDSRTSLTGHAYGSYTVNDGSGVLQPWFMEYTIAEADLPAGVTLGGTWTFWARAVQPTFDEAFYDPAQHFQDNKGNDSHLLFVKGDAGDASGDDWYAQSIASASSADDRILNGASNSAGVVADQWFWWSTGDDVQPVLQQKQLVVEDGAVTFRISERESHELNARIDVIVWSSDPNYVPTDADFEALRLPGDADLNNVVDLADLAILATNWNAEGVWFDGNFNDDDIVDLADLAALATNWNETKDFAVAAAAMGLPAIPEPATLSLLGLGLAALLRRRR